MKKFFNFISYLVSITLIGVSGYYAYTIGVPRFFPCSQIITYRIGTFDTRFAISEEDFKKEIEAASIIWENSAGKDLFKYDPKGKLEINLVYDERQQNTNNIKKMENDITATKSTSDSIKAEYRSLKAKYDTNSKVYDSLLANYNKKKAEYDAEVKYWNEKGGAPKDKYNELQIQKNELIALQDELNAKGKALNASAEVIQALVSKYNYLVEDINQNLDEYNNNDFVGSEFEEGLYTSDVRGRKIDIYQFTDKEKLLRVLAHELGHALSLDHNSNPDSIMYALNESDTKTLSKEDVDSLKNKCRI